MNAWLACGFGLRGMCYTNGMIRQRDRMLFAEEYDWIFLESYFGSHVVRGFWLVIVTDWCNLYIYWMWCDVDRAGRNIDESIVVCFLK